MKLALFVCCAIAALLPPPAGAALYELQPGQAFTVAGTREGCASQSTPTQPLLTCSLWGRTTRVIPGTLYFEFGPTVADVFQRTLDGSSGLLREYPQPAQAVPPQPATAAEPLVFVVGAGDGISVAGTDVDCVVAKRSGDLGVTCRKLEAGTGLPLSTSVAVTLSGLAVTASRIRADRSGSTTFALAQPFVPTPRTVARQQRALRAAMERLGAIRRSDRAYGAGRYGAPRSGLLGIAADLAHDRFVAACLRFDPLLYAGFNLPRGHTRLLFVRRMRKIDRALC